jgi:hypothetical protein
MQAQAIGKNQIENILWRFVEQCDAAAAASERFTGPNGDLFRWSSCDHAMTDFYNFVLRLSDYNSGGYVVDFDPSSDASKIQNFLASLRENSFVDARTDSISIAFTLNNNQQRLLEVVNLVVSLPYYGGVKTSSYFGARSSRC